MEKRQKSDLIKKHEKIGELLGLERVPLHTLVWKEPRLELIGGDCYPVVDILERVAGLIDKLAKGAALTSNPIAKKKPAFTAVSKKKVK